jgi:hypothetical protein
VVASIALSVDPRSLEKLEVESINQSPNTDLETWQADANGARGILISQENIDIGLMRQFSSKDLTTQLAKLMAHRRRRQTDRELAIDYELAIRVYDEYRFKRDWNVSFFFTLKKFQVTSPL